MGWPWILQRFVCIVCGGGRSWDRFQSDVHDTTNRTAVWFDAVLLLERDGIPRRHDEATREFARTAAFYVSAVAARLAASFARV